MARLASGRTSSPLVACRALSARHAKGQARSPRARCVAAGAKALRELRPGARVPGAAGARRPSAGAAEDADDDVSIEDDSGEPATPGDGAGEPAPGDDDGGDAGDPDVVIEDPDGGDA